MGSSCWNIQPDPSFLFAPGFEDGHRRVLCIPEKNMRGRNPLTVSFIGKVQVFYPHSLSKDGSTDFRW